MIYFYIRKPKPTKKEGEETYCIKRGAEDTTVCGQRYPQPCFHWQSNPPGPLCAKCDEGCPEARTAVKAEPVRASAVVKEPQKPLDPYDLLFKKVKSRSRR